jgi:hypothetical protein
MVTAWPCYNLMFVFRTIFMLKLVGLTIRDSWGKGDFLGRLLLAAGEISKNDQSLTLRY